MATRHMLQADSAARPLAPPEPADYPAPVHPDPEPCGAPRPPAEPHPGLVTTGSDRLAFTLTGLHLGLLQTALFFAAQVYVSATALGYFVVVTAWMAGVLVSIRSGRPRHLPAALALSVGALMVLLAAGSVLAPGARLYPLVFALAFASALPAGTFFRHYSGRHASSTLFLHENNGFVLGLLAGMFGFVHWGVDFLPVGPLLSLLAVLAAFRHPGVVLGLVLPGAALAAQRLGNAWLAWTLVATWALVAAVRFAPMPRRSPARPAGAPAASPRVPAPRLLLALAGANLILLQYFITREFSTLLAASELAILIVAVAYFAGFSVGYAASRRLPWGLLRWAAAGTFALHLALLAYVRVAAALLIDAGYGAGALAGLLFAAAFTTSSFYSVLLPRVIDDLGLPLEKGYAWDLVGAVSGTTFMLVVVPWHPELLWPAYFTALLAIVVLLHWPARSTLPLAFLCASAVAALAVLQGPLHRLATEDYYRTRGYENPRLLFSKSSFHHSVDVLDTYAEEGDQEPTSRVSFINGVRYFRQYAQSQNRPEASLSEFTYFLAALPARYQYQRLGRPLRVLVLGGGSLSTLERVAPFSRRTTLVEIDPVVVESAQRYWRDVNHWDEVENAEIVIDDARHYLRTTEETFDLVINDVSAPYYLGTAIMHSAELYELVRDRLAPNGLFSESTQSAPRPSHSDSTAMRILRGVADVFPHWRAVEGQHYPRARRGYVYATAGSGLRTADLTDLMKADGKYSGTATFWEGTDRYRLHRSEPFSLTNMSSLLASNAGRISRRLGLDGDEQDQEISLGRVLREAADPRQADHSRLLVASLGAAQSPRVWGLLALLVVLAAALSRWRFPSQNWK